MPNPLPGLDVEGDDARALALWTFSPPSAAQTGTPRYTVTIMPDSRGAIVLDTVSGTVDAYRIELVGAEWVVYRLTEQ